MRRWSASAVALVALALAAGGSVPELPDPEGAAPDRFPVKLTEGTWLAFPTEMAVDYPGARGVVFLPEGEALDTWGKLYGDLVLTDARGVQWGRITGSTRLPYGCDGVSTPFAGVSAPEPITGVAWLGVQATPVPIADGVVQSERRTWSIGDAALQLKTTGRRSVQLGLAVDGVEVLSEAYDSPLMDGAEDTALDLTALPDVGVPVPIGAWTRGESLVIALRRPSWEGWHVDWIEDGVLRQSVVYVYQCAF